MTNKNLKQDYTKMQEIKAAYDTARTQENTEGMEAARDAHQALMAEVESRGGSYEKVFQLYEDAMERGNEYIDLRDVIWDKDVAGLMSSLRKTELSILPFPPHGRAQLKQHGSLHRTGAFWKGWWKSTAPALV